MNVENWK